MRNYNSAYQELTQRLFFSLFAVVLFKVGCLVPLPFINVEQLFAAGGNPETWSILPGNNFLKTITSFSGGALQKASIFTIGLSPYIFASITSRLLFAYIPYFKQMKKTEEDITEKYTKILTFTFAVLQSFAFSTFLYNSIRNSYITVDDYFLFTAVNTFVLTAGSVFVYWLSKIATQKGIAQGSSLLITTNILSRLPQDLSSFIIGIEQGRIGTLSTIFNIAILFALIYFIVFIEISFKKIPIEYPSRQQGKQVYLAQKTFLPLKVNLAGILPAIGSFNLLALIKLFFDNLANNNDKYYRFVEIFADNHPVYLTLSFSLVLVLSIFWGKTDFNPKDLAKRLENEKAFISNIRPGQQTVKYLEEIINKMVIVSALYISTISILPGIISFLLLDKSLVGTYGLSILITVSLFQEIVSRVDVLIKAAEYPNLIKQTNISNLNRID